MEFFKNFRRVVAIIVEIIWSFTICYFWSLFTGKGYPFLFMPLIFTLFFLMFFKTFKKG